MRVVSAQLFFGGLFLSSALGNTKNPAVVVKECETKSHSQSEEEDGIINAFFKGKMGGQYLEMGALNGVKYSNTLVLANCSNWKGLLIEGSKQNFDALQKNVRLRPANSVRTVYGAVCAPPQTSVKFTEGGKAVSGDMEQMYVNTVLMCIVFSVYSV